MPKLEIIRTERKEIRFFLGWNADQSCIYAQDKKGNYRLIPIELPSLDLHDLIGNSVGLSFKNRPFPKSAPIRIEPFRLIPPPCRAARDYDPKTLKHNARDFSFLRSAIRQILSTHKTRMNLPKPLPLLI